MRELTSLIAAVGVGTMVAAASAQAGSGGQSVPERPRIDRVACRPSAGSSCPRSGALVGGGLAVISGTQLDATTQIVFRGARGRADDSAAPPITIDAGTVTVKVPAGARSGPLVVVSDFGEASSPRPVTIGQGPAAAPRDTAPGGSFFFAGNRQPTFTFDARSDGPVAVEVVRKADGIVVRTLQTVGTAGHQSIVRWDGMGDDGAQPSGIYRFRVAAGASAAAQPRADALPEFALYDNLFPIRGRHNMGYTKTNGFGGGRGHQGQDMFAACGTPLAAARGGRVEYAGYQSAAGNYVVVSGAGNGLDYVYMHMRDVPLVRTGQQVFTGQQIGVVGATGHATGCHLHFELWSAPGWYKGGAPFDPQPSLLAWDAYS